MKKVKYKKVDWKKAHKKTLHWEERTITHENDLLKHLNKKDLILDVGCGNGRYSVFFTKKGFRVIGIDISPDAIKKAETNARKNKVIIHFDIGNAERLPYNDSFFDVIHCGSLLHHANLKKVSKEITRVLRKKGLLYIYTFIETHKIKTQEIRTYYTEKEYINAFKKNFRVLKKQEFETFDRKPEPHKHKVLVLLLRKK